MKKHNIWRDVIPPLEGHEDIRGRIVDIFYNAQIQHASVIDTNPGSIRGDHYHEQTVQFMLITKGSLEYWYKPLDSKEPAVCVVLNEGDFVETPQREIHALRMIGPNQFIAFTVGVRGGKDYESDTIRVKPSIIPDEFRSGFKRLGHQI
jgi:hypothetical protein